MLFGLQFGGSGRPTPQSLRDSPPAQGSDSEGAGL